MRVALVVDDEYESQVLARDALRLAGFESILIASSRAEALDITPEIFDTLDLLVVDRNIWETSDQTPSVDVGDRLLLDLLKLAPGRPVIVFTGWVDSPLFQSALDMSTQIMINNPDGFLPQIMVLEKDQTADLVGRAKRLLRFISLLEEIEIDTEDDVDEITRRLMRRLASISNGRRISVKKLGGGRSGSTVWACTVFDVTGNVIARYVSKETSDISGGKGFLGLQSAAMASMVASHKMQVFGMSGRRALDVFQSAGDSPISLWQLVRVDGALAEQLLVRLARGLQPPLVSAATSVTIAQAVEHFVKWDDLANILRERFDCGLNPNLMVASKRDHQHGDLHGDNILVSGDQVLLIDFDMQGVASRAVDPLTLLLSWYLHPDGPGFETTRPTVEQLIAIVAGYGPYDVDNGGIVRSISEWIQTEVSGARDRWASVLAYSLRQFKYHSEAEAPITYARLDGLVRKALEILAE